MELDPGYIDHERLDREASRTQLLLDALRQREEARVMLKRLWPMIQELKEALDPLEREYQRWAMKHYHAERRVAEVRKRMLKPSASARRRERKEMTTEGMTRHFSRQSQSERLRLLKELEAMIED